MNILDLAGFEELNGENFKDKSFDVTVLVNVYNFGRFLPDALEGIVSQKCDYAIEVLIHDDGSTDDSAEIIRQYSEKFPNLIHAFIGHQNVYGTLSVSEGVEFEHQWMEENIHGKYVAYCEGDDYWKDPDKLQLQITYMKEHPDCHMTMHDATLWDYRDNSKHCMKPAAKDYDLSAQELILQETGIWPTASMVFTRDVAICPKWLLMCWIGDWPRQLYAVSKGNVHFFARNMCVYRYMHTGSWSKETSVNVSRAFTHCIQMMHFLAQYDDYTCGNYHDEIVERCGQFYMNFLGNISCYKNLLEVVDKTDENDKKIHCWEIDRIITIYRLIKDEDYLPIELERFISKHTDIYIYGNGKNAHLLSDKFNSKKIHFNGYVVSDNEEISDERCDVRHISEIKDDQAAFVVGVGPQHYKAIKKAISDHNGEYIFPFVIADFHKV